jgi:S-sulfosulfanyl-L-cysteine sulfohydrolase
LTYPNTWSREMTGAEIKHVMEDVANNLFHPDPMRAKAVTWFASAD